MTASDTATDPAQRGIFLVCRANISPCDKTALLPTIPDTETVQRIGRKAPPRLARQRADTPDESHMFSAQVRRGLNRAPRGQTGIRGALHPLRGRILADGARRAGHHGPFRGAARGWTQLSIAFAVGRLKRSNARRHAPCRGPFVAGSPLPPAWLRHHTGAHLPVAAQYIRGSVRSSSTCAPSRYSTSAMNGPLAADGEPT